MEKFLKKNYKAILAGTAILTVVIGILGFFKSGNNSSGSFSPFGYSNVNSTVNSNSNNIGGSVFSNVQGPVMTGDNAVNIHNEYDREAEKQKDVVASVRQAPIECQRGKKQLSDLPVERYASVMLPNFENLVPARDFIEVVGEQKFYEIKEFFGESLQSELSAIQMQAVTSLMLNARMESNKKRLNDNANMNIEALEPYLTAAGEEKLMENLNEAKKKKLKRAEEVDAKTKKGSEDSHDLLNARKQIFLGKMDQYCQMILASIQ